MTAKDWILGLAFTLIGVIFGIVLSIRITIGTNESLINALYFSGVIIFISLIYLMTFTMLKDSLFGQPGLYLSNFRVDRKSRGNQPILFSESIEKYSLNYDVEYGKMSPIYNKILDIETLLNLEPPIFKIDEKQINESKCNINSEKLKNIEIRFGLHSPNFDQMELYQNYKNVKLIVTLRTTGIGKNISQSMILNIGEIKLISPNELFIKLIKKGFVKKGETLQEIAKINGILYKTNISFNAKRFIDYKEEDESKFLYNVIKRLIYTQLYKEKQNIYKIEAYQSDSLQEDEKLLAEEMCDLTQNLKREIEEDFTSSVKTMIFSLFQTPEFNDKLGVQEKGLCLFGIPTDKVIPIINLEYSNLKEIVKHDEEILNIILEKTD